MAASFATADKEAHPAGKCEAGLSSQSVEQRNSVRNLVRPSDRHGFRQVLELLHPAHLLDDLQHLGHTLDAAQRLDRVGYLLDLLQRDRAAIRRGLRDTGAGASTTAGFFIAVLAV